MLPLPCVLEPADWPMLIFNWPSMFSPALTPMLMCSFLSPIISSTWFLPASWPIEIVLQGLASAPLPIATEFSEVARAFWPKATLAWPVAVALLPAATESSAVALVSLPSATDLVPDAVAPKPIAVASWTPVEDENRLALVPIAMLLPTLLSVPPVCWPAFWPSAMLPLPCVLEPADWPMLIFNWPSMFSPALTPMLMCSFLSPIISSTWFLPASWPIEIVLQGLASAPLPIATEFSEVARAFWPKATLAWPVAVALLPAARAKLPADVW